MNQFNQQLAIQFRESGIKQCADNNQHFLRVARNIALALARKNGSVTSDDVRRNCPLDPLHPNAYGGIFKDRRFKWSGEFRQSHLVSRRGGLQRLWVLSDAERPL